VRAALVTALAAALGLFGPAAAHAGVLRYCDEPAPLSAAQQDRLLRFGGIVKAELERSGARVALIARSGLDLRRFGQRYSHAGVSLRASPETPWAVRQLYFDCDQRRPRLFDQGMAAFVLGADEPALGFVSVLLLPPQPAAALERTALHDARALELLGARYSANAYPYSLRYQNCNQWVAELLASAWSDDGDAVAPGDAAARRAHAQSWLLRQGFEPTVFDLGWRALRWAGVFIPWIHDDDHPAADLAQPIYRVSMPASIEAFVQRQLPGATRIEFCHTETQVVVRRGGEPIADGCRAGAQDTVIALE